MKKQPKKSYTNHNGRRVRKVDKASLAWHFHAGRLAYGDNREVVSGKVYEVEHDPLNPTKQIVLCRRGLHASRKLLQAWDNVPAHPDFISRVEIRGWVTTGRTKLACSERKVLWTIPVDYELRKFLWSRNESAARKYVMSMAKKRGIKTLI